MVFPLPGATVDLSASDEHAVRIVGLSRRLSGVFACEVSADAPLFHTDIRAAPLTIVDPPNGALELSGRGTYARGAPLRAVCRVPPAYPQPNITWTLDGVQIAEQISPPPAEGDFSERATTSELELTLTDAADAADARRVPAPYAPYTPYALAADDPMQPRREQFQSSVASAGGAAAGAARLAVWAAAPAAGRGVLRCEARQHDAWKRAAPPLLLREDAPRPASVTRGDDGASSASVATLTSLCLSGALLIHLL